MSDRRPSKPELGDLRVAQHKGWYDSTWTEYRRATLEDLIAVVRRGVESGTIEGQRVAWCERHRATGASDSEGYGVCWFIMFAELMPKAYPDWSQHASHLPCKMTEPYGALLIPVSDGGSET